MASTNENANRLLRQYFPYGTDLSTHSQCDLNKVARRLNKRPRKTLGFGTPADKLSASDVSTSLILHMLFREGNGWLFIRTRMGHCVCELRLG